jgi:ATP-dependent DNA helicase DinG
VPQITPQHFTDSARLATREAIRDAGGNEVFLLGTLDESGAVDSVRVLARGNRSAVPALMQIPRPGEVVIHNHPSGELTPSGADLDIAAALGNNAVGAYIVDNDVGALYVVVEPHRPTATEHLDAEGTERLLGPGGEVSAALDGYEHRPQQLAMLRAVVGAFNDGTTLTVEAGTGTGKSLAYLIPAIDWALRNKERVVVATHTINLQEQLIAKDLPLLTERAGRPVTTALVKGRGNYVCQRKAAQARAQPALLIEDDFVRELNELLAWAAKTKDGSLGDLAVRPRPEVWEQVVSENDNCLRARCPHYSTCFFYTARRNAALADIIVVNHHLLLADLALRAELGSYTQNAVLPPAQRIIVDEAHHLEDVSTSYFGMSASFRAIERVLGRLQSATSPGKGVLPALLVQLESIEAPDDQIVAEGAVRVIEERLLARRAGLLASAQETFLHLLDGFEAHVHQEVVAGREQKLRVVPALRASAYWSLVENGLQRLATAFADYAEDFEPLRERLESLGEESEKKVISLTTEVFALRGRVRAFAAALEAFVREDEAQCKWIEVRNRGRWGKAISFHTAPIHVGAQLRAALFEQFPTVVMTSATLTVGRKFDYLHERIGLNRLGEPERVRTLRVESPFDFASQALLAVPRDFPDPANQRYEAATHAAIRRIAQATGGGTFVLFTAYGALNRAVEALADELGRAGLKVLRQGEMNRQLLLERFVSDPRSVLFATDSFWEGVDVRGDALRCVVITKLPFRVPTEPIEEARVEEIQRRGGNPFMEHALPQAVIKLKQGFGRLIRSRTDRGAVVLLDSRVVSKFYGKVFLESLPPARRLIAPTESVLAEIDRFFAPPVAQS